MAFAKTAAAAALALLLLAAAPAAADPVQDTLDAASDASWEVAKAYASAAGTCGDACGPVAESQAGGYELLWGVHKLALLTAADAVADAIAACEDATADMDTVCMDEHGAWRAAFQHPIWDTVLPQRWTYLGCATAPDGMSHVHVWLHDPWFGESHIHEYVGSGRCPEHSG